MNNFFYIKAISLVPINMLTKFGNYKRPLAIYKLFAIDNIGERLVYKYSNLLATLLDEKILD